MLNFQQSNTSNNIPKIFTLFLFFISLYDYIGSKNLTHHLFQHNKITNTL
jgi:hypothetical protein